MSSHLQHGVQEAPPRHGGGRLPGQAPEMQRDIIDHAAPRQFSNVGPGSPEEQPPNNVHVANYRNLSHPNTKYRWEYPNAHLRPQYEYISNGPRFVRDIMGRVKQKWYPDDRYISPYDGRAKPLCVQATDDIYRSPNNTTHLRTFMRNTSPFMLRIAKWPLNHFNYIDENTPASDYWYAAAKWIPATAALTVMLMFPGNASGQERNGGRYDPFPYKFYNYPKAARNTFEDDCLTIAGRRTHHTTNPEIKRTLRPRYLCVLSADDKMTRIKTEDWEKNNKGKPLDYVFIAYTADQFDNDTDSDVKALHAIAKTATRAVGLNTYWVGCSCMPDKDEIEQDVYRISDVIRGAHSLIIAVGPNNKESAPSFDLQLVQWGTRMWTWPEVLLSPGDSIKVFSRENNDVVTITKRQFAQTVWKDAEVSRQLIDHYEGSIILGRLELVTLALQCLQGRETSQHLHGDKSYALMGLMRLRPKIDRSDTAFQAFARLSLANDSDMLLERLISTLPKNPTQHWSCMDDAWNSKLWDIYPTCQIAGIGRDDTVIIDGLRGANVRWKSFEVVRSEVRANFKRTFTLFLQHSAPLFFYVSIGLLAAGNALRPSNKTAGDTYTFVGVVFIIYSLIAIIGAPWFVKLLYGGKFWQTQPWLFGFEGYLPVETIEKQVFGTNLGRLSWSPYSSPLSRHKRNEHDECIGIDPTTDPEVRSLVSQATHATPGQMRVFTIVDTGNMEVTMFQAIRPPVAFLLAGEEGGMQRAVGVSYQWETQTCYRETIMRMPTTTKDLMTQVNRVRFGLKREMPPTRPVRGADQAV
ncbi:hypothetical protein M409DRAFT_69329 [Zasmidium cellare ATCC 36951]|uniref:Heterokaryon incompatibility domain-containing protein n=1 Tax=Zasmidium cellare ATCC 36951 TaxID=1080233 RepID=A0A6A6C530_ZASCE|nr:uncharacterized protein M409DRAFT_69329 [Zasmidium cellare ATCC 36951]KAF2162115.1 hypothetical protein M409DRAFT_69329 [Zasmidium cellare ATCC 36951]